MELFDRNESEFFGVERGLEMLTVVLDILSLVPIHETKVQNMLSIESACAANSGAESMNEPGKFLKGSEAKNLQSFAAVKRPRRRNGKSLWRIWPAAIPRG